MSDIGHILRKDLRRLRLPLVAWLLIVVGRLLLASAGAAAAFGDLGSQIAIDTVSPLVTAIDLLMLALLVSRLVHDEPLVGADAFWLTRPIAPMQLMTEKLVFAALFLVAAPVAGEWIVVAWIGGGVRDAVHAAPGLALAQALWVVPLLALATLTPSVMRFFLVIVASAAAVAGFFSALALVLVLTTSDDALGLSSPPSGDVTGTVVASCLLIASALFVITYQYRYRRLGRAIVLGAVALAATVAITTVWPWPFARASEPEPGLWAQDSRTVLALDRSAVPYATDSFSLRDRSTSRKLIALPIRLTNMPPEFSADTFVVRARLALPDGVILQSVQGMNVSVRQAGGGALSTRTTRLDAALANVRLIGVADDEYGQWPAVLRISSEHLARYGTTPGRLFADVDAFVYRSRLAGSTPLVPGASLRHGSTRFEILRVARRPDGCTVLVRQSSASFFGTSGAGTSYELVLRNTQRGEAVLGQREFSAGTGLHAGTWFVSMPSVALGFSFSHLVEHFPARGPFDRGPRIDAAWLDGADLAMVESTYAGHVSRTMTIEDFRMVQVAPQAQAF